ncbi:MAG: hypothetical protein CL868_06720 [Cytophagaceae bacterium]|nr:hypothetical protein [Cytophagaceae bacterium]|tara:strand:- start:19114 stop:19680 length:567 start_codon:yes stop_codon:yes gene_type:complete
MKQIMVLLCAAAMFVGCQKQAKTGFVNTEKIVKEYKEMTDAQDKYSKMNEDFQSSLEGKIQSYEAKVQLYQKNAAKMSASERSSKEEEILALRNQIQNEQQTRSRQLQAESQAAIDTIIKKIKVFVKDYGENNGYDYIYGQNEGGSVMYGKEQYDLTSEILEELNAKYTPGSTSSTPAAETTDTTATK